MCGAHIQDAGDDMPPSEEDTYVQSTYLGCVRRYTTERQRCGNTRAEEKQERKDKKENKQKFTPETDEKGFRGELIYNKKTSWILIKLKST